ncbi:MAG: hypothetical protein FWD47_04580 [Treponema sp.]|nr:hypothetical protein [Treponema sp.]
MADFFKGISSGQKYEMLRKLGAGGQGTVIQVKNKDGKQYAAKWYKPSTVNTDQRDRITKLISRGCPIAPDKGIKFIWPIEMISHDQSKNGFGYVMPLIEERFVTLHKVVIGNAQQPNLQILSRISYLLALALDTIHASGLAYCDINMGNLMFDPENGDIIICDNDNVVTNTELVPVKGVWEFMAPEVALNKSNPNAQTDTYSAAIMLFYMWMWEHPMEGKKTLNIYSWDIPAKKKLYASEPVFIFDPNDTSNNAEGIEDLQTCVKRWERMCSPKLKELFTVVFTKGVNDPSYRTQLRDWQRVFLELNANTVNCPKCNSINTWDGKQSPFTCFNCNNEIPFQLFLTIDHGFNNKTNILVLPNVTLRQHHLEIANFDSNSTKELGTIEQHPNDKKASILRNNTDKAWKYKAPDSSEYSVEPGQARALLPNCEIVVGGVSVKVEGK